MAYFHVWFVTKHRKPFLRDGLEQLVKREIIACGNRHGYRILALETCSDHAHILIEAHGREELSKMIRTIKAVSAKEVLATSLFREGNFKHFWARRYGVRVVGETRLLHVVEYVRNQNMGLKTHCKKEVSSI